MVTDLLTEHRISMTELASQEGVTIPTVWRWRQRGVRGVKLETFMVGGRRFTTREAHRRFVVLTTAAADGDQQPAVIQVATNRQLQARASQTDAGLARHGVES